MTDKKPAPDRVHISLNSQQPKGVSAPLGSAQPAKKADTSLARPPKPSKP